MLALVFFPILSISFTSFVVRSSVLWVQGLVRVRVRIGGRGLGIVVFVWGCPVVLLVHGFDCSLWWGSVSELIWVMGAE